MSPSLYVLYYILCSTNLDNFILDLQVVILIQAFKTFSKHTGLLQSKDWELVYQEIFNTKQEAMQREKQIKVWKNKYRIKELINEAQPNRASRHLWRGGFRFES